MAILLEGRFECHTFPNSDPSRPAGWRVGIQEGKEVAQDTALEGQSEIHFGFTLQVALEAEGGAVSYKGKVVQGPRAEPFIYLTWGDWVEGVWAQFGRSKIPLNAIPRELIERRLQDGGVLRARIRLSDQKGRPALATLKEDFVEWVE